MPFCSQCALPYASPARFCGGCGAALPEAPSPADPGEPSGPGLAPPGDEDRWVGKTVDRRYHVLSRLGVGGMGLVYKVEHVHLAKIAAMKVLHPEMARDAEAVRRFRIEAQAVSRLDHPNIVQTFDFGQSDDALYLVMEYLKGEDLAAIVKREGTLPFDRAARLFIQVCSALTEAHESGVIHRDLKPENIMVVQRRDGTEAAKVLDFGLAKLRERSDTLGVTSGNQVIGTPYYMSPEQVRSEPLDVRTDIYSLGATLYRVLTGTPPFQATTPMGVLTKHVTDPLELPRTRAPALDLPPMADAIVSRAMAKSPDDRYDSAADIARDLQAALAARPRPSSPTTIAPTVREGRPVLAAARHEERPPRAMARDIDRRDHDQGGSTGRNQGGDAGGNVGEDRSSPSWPPGADDRQSSAGWRTESDRADPAAISDSQAGTGADRLRRREFDAFERALLRRRRLGALAVPVALAAAAGLAAFALTHSREKAGVTEREPNDSAAQATLLPLDQPVAGHVGKRLAPNAPDMDYFRIPSSKETRVVSARLEGIPDVDLVLELFDGQGVALAKSDARGKGGGEWIQPTAVGPGEAFILVRQLWTQDVPLAEDVPDAYSLAAHFGPPQAGWESEPNDTPASANPVATDAHRVRGYLGRADDRDWYTFVSSTPGTYVATVDAPPGLDVALLASDAPADGAAPRARASRPNERPARLTFDVRAGAPFLVGVARKGDPGDGKPGRSAKAGPAAPRSAADPTTQGVPAIAEPYELVIAPAATR